MKVDMRMVDFVPGVSGRIEIDVPAGFRLADMLTSPLSQINPRGSMNADGSFCTVLRFERVKP